MTTSNGFYRLMRTSGLFAALLLPTCLHAKVVCTNPDVSLMVPYFKNRAAAESWVPDEISFDSTSVNWYGSHVNEASSNTEFYFFAEKRKISGKYSQARNNLTFQLGSPAGIRPTGPAIYKSCTFTNASNSNPHTNFGGRQEFNTANSCQRRYIQSYLKTAGLYKSTIDGKWGKGTAAALTKANSIRRFKNKSVDQVIKILSEESPC